MDNEELEKKMEFIVHQGAQSDIKLFRLNRIVTRLENSRLRRFKGVDEKTRDVDERISALVDSQIRLTDAQTRNEANLNEKMNALVDSQIKLDDSHRRLAESQALTDERLRALIAAVDRHLSGNGHSGNSN